MSRVIRKNLIAYIIIGFRKKITNDNSKTTILPNIFKNNTKIKMLIPPTLLECLQNKRSPNLNIIDYKEKIKSIAYLRLLNRVEKIIRASKNNPFFFLLPESNPIPKIFLIAESNHEKN